MAAPPLSPELQALLDETNKRKDDKPIDNPLKSPTIQQILSEEQTDTAPNAFGRGMANEMVLGFGPQTLPFLQKYFEQPLRKVASTIREGVGLSALPEIPVNTTEELQEQIDRDQDKHPIASGLGAGTVQGARVVGGAGLAGLASPVMAGAGMLPRMAALSAGGVPASVAKRGSEVIRGEKTSGEAAGDIGADALLNAGSGILGPLGKFGAGGRIADASRPFTSAEQNLALTQGRNVMPRLQREMTAEAGATTPGILTGVKEAARGATQPYTYGPAGIAAEFAAQAAGAPYAVGGLAGMAAPGVIAGLRQIGQNVGSRSASQVLGLLGQRPDLVLKMAGNPTLYQQALEALMAGSSSEAIAP